MSDEGLLITPNSSNKRSFTDQFVDYVKKSKCLFPRDQICSSKRGSLCLTYSISRDDRTNNYILNLHVIRARQLSFGHPDSHLLNTFVKVKFCQYEQSSKIIYNSHSPIYDEKFNIPIDENSLKRLIISVYHQSITTNNKSDLIGCMSFNMKTLLKTSKTSSKCKWYCLLPESIGRHKRVPLNVEKRRTTPSTTNGMIVNVEVLHRDDIRFASGYPCTISEIKGNITSVMPGDILLQVNDINVSRTQAKAVQKLMKNLPLPINLQLYRRNLPSTTTTATTTSSIKIDKIVLNSVDQHQPLSNQFLPKPSDDQYSFSDTYADRAFCSSDKVFNQYDCILPEEQSLFMSPIRGKRVDQSDGSESGVGSESNPSSDGEHRLKTPSDVYEREVLHLIDIEKEFINQLEIGVQLYSRPLKHYLISSMEHAKLFQNIEKILAISRYQLNRLQSLSDRTIVHHIGQIFHEKVQLICEAFSRYFSGYADACFQLKQLTKCASFERFIHGKNFSIEQFLQIPLNHMENLANQLDILCCTCNNGNDANYLLHVLKELRQCLLNQDSNPQHCTTTMTLNSASGMTSSVMNQSEDEQILDLQNRLQCPSNLPSVILTGRNRHVIFSGVLLLQNENKNYIETWAILLNDMLLFTQRNATDMRLTLISEPIYLTDIVDFRSSTEREDALIFLSTKPTLPYKIRYPSQCLQCAWQTILEQRLKTWQRSIHDESSSADSDLE